jgi:hypothetical protein
MLVRLRGFRRNTRLLDYVVLAVLLVSVALVAGCEPAPQYSLWGFTWESVDPLYYHFDTGAGDNTQLAFSAALADWNATSTPVNFQPSSDDFVVTLGEEDDPAANWDGITTVVQHDGWTFLQVEAVLNAHYTDSYPTLDRRAVACHELGHVLGLDEFDGEVLMNQQTAVRFFELGIYAPQQGDIDGVNAMYG